MARNSAQFWDMADIKDVDDCWLWTGGVCHQLRHTYGWTKFKGKQMTAHRIAVILDGRDPTKKRIFHTCGNTLCVNPKHLVMRTTIESDRRALGEWK